MKPSLYSKIRAASDIKYRDSEFLLTDENIRLQVSEVKSDLEKLKTYKYPSLLVYYGNPVGVKGLNDVNRAADFYMSHDLVIFGDGYQYTGHANYADTVAIISRIKQESTTRVFGYIAAAESAGVLRTITQLQSDIDDWKTAGATDIFVDTYGYDYGVTRDHQNAIVNYIHGQGMKAMVNAYNPEDVFTTQDITRNGYRGNPSGTASVVGDGDFAMVEAFGVVNSENGFYYAPVEQIDKYERFHTMGLAAGVKLAAVSVFDDTRADLYEQIEFVHGLAYLNAIDYLGYNVNTYGSEGIKELEMPKAMPGVTPVGGESVIRKYTYAGQANAERRRLLESGDEIVVYMDYTGSNFSAEFPKIDSYARILAMQSQLDITAQQIQSKVSQTEMETYIADLSVGNKNYLIYPKGHMLTGTRVTGEGGTSIDMSGRDEIEMDPSALTELRNKEVTLSFWAKTENLQHEDLGSSYAGIQIRIEFMDSSSFWLDLAHYSYGVQPGTADWTLYQRTQTIPDKEIKNIAGGTAADPLAFKVSGPMKYVTGSLYIKDFKLEIGDKVTNDNAPQIMKNMNTRLTTAETNITQNAESISLKASQSVVDGINTRLSDAETKITPSAITTTVRSSSAYTADLAAKATPADIDTKIGNIKLGGKNLLLESKYETPLTSNVYSIAYFFLTEKPEEGEPVTISIKGDLGDDRTYWGIYNSGGNVSMVSIGHEAKEADGVYRATFPWKITSGAYTANNTYVNIYQLYNTGTSSSTIEWVKLEKGNKATDWTPAPEDFDTKIEEAKNSVIEQTNESITLSVSETKKYIQSRGENLVTNGTGLLGDNTNFSYAEFDASDSYNANGSFTFEGEWDGPESNELMPVNPDNTYRFKYYAKANPYVGSPVMYGYVSCYDADGFVISPSHTMYRPNTTTTLAATLAPGATTVQLTSAANWYNTSDSETYNRAFIFWNYVNQGGYAWPTETYSRNYYSNWWNGGAVNTTNNTITLNKPWTGPTIPAGTPVSNGTSGGALKYIAGAYSAVYPEWTPYEGTIGGVDMSGQNDSSKFHPGTASVRVGWLCNVNSPTGKTWLSNISFQIDYAGDIEDLKDRTTETESQISQTSDKISLVVKEVNGQNQVDGNALVSAINVEPSTIKIASKNINIQGAVTFDSLSDSLFNKVSDETGVLNVNPTFSKWSTTYPEGYVYSAGSAPTKVASDNGKPNAAQWTLAASESAYMHQDVGNIGGYTYVTVEATFKLTSGAISGAGILTRYVNGSGGTMHDFHTNFAQIVPSPTLNRWYTVSKTFKASTLTDFNKYRIYVMGGWSSFGTMSAKTIQFDSVRVRAASDSEIRAYDTGGRVDSWTMPGKTTINGGNIETNTITATQIAAKTITANNIKIGALNLIGDPFVENPALGTSAAATALANAGWNNGFDAANSEIVSDGTYGKVLRLRSIDNRNIFTNKFAIDPSKAYKVSITLKMTTSTGANPTGALYVGLNMYKADGTSNLSTGGQYYQGSKTFGVGDTNPYFYTPGKGNSAHATWKTLECYVLPHAHYNDRTKVKEGVFPTGDGKTLYFSPEAKQMHIRLLNYNSSPSYGDGTTPNDLYIASLQVTEVDSGTLVADNITTGTLDASKVTVSADGGSVLINGSGIQATKGDVVTSMNSGSGFKITKAGNDVFRVESDGLIYAKGLTSQAQFDNLSVGGRNILRNSGNFRDGDIPYWYDNGGGLSLDQNEAYNGYWTLKTTVGSGIVGDWYTLKNNVEYVYSVTLKANAAFNTSASSGSSPIHYWAGLNNVSQSKITVLEHSTQYLATDVGKYKRLWIRFKLNSDANSFRPFIYFGSSQSIVFNIANLQLEEGNLMTDWTPAPEDAGDEIYGIKAWVAESRQLLSEDNIVSTVTASTVFQDELNNKASLEELSAYASLTALDAAKLQMQDYADGKISEIDMSTYVKTSELTQTQNDFNIKLTRAGGVNLLQNSVGWAEKSVVPSTDPIAVAGNASWILTGSGSWEVVKGTSELIGLGAGAAWKLNLRTITQNVPVVSGETYTFQMLVKKEAGDAGGYIDIDEGDNLFVQKQVYLTASAYNWTAFSHTFTAKSGNIGIRIRGAGTGNTLITNVMLNKGALPMQWTHAKNEIHNSNVRFDLGGIVVQNSATNGETRITPEEFAGYARDESGAQEKIFTLNGDTTEVKKLKASEEFAMGPLRILQIESGSVNGWAFLPRD